MLSLVACSLCVRMRFVILSIKYYYYYYYCYIHQTVNHKLHFVSEKGTHTSNIENRWCALKASLPRYGTWKKFHSSYFSEYCIHQKFIDCASDKLIAVLNLVSQIYKLELPAIAGPSLAAQISELLAEQQDTAGTRAETNLLLQAQLIAQALLQAPEPTVNTDKTGRAKNRPHDCTTTTQ